MRVRCARARGETDERGRRNYWLMRKQNCELITTMMVIGEKLLKFRLIAERRRYGSCKYHNIDIYILYFLMNKLNDSLSLKD